MLARAVAPAATAGTGAAHSGVHRQDRNAMPGVCEGGGKLH
jgi:hypothetical protein